jgi:hypothetical protein
MVKNDLGHSKIIITKINVFSVGTDFISLYWMEVRTKMIYEIINSCKKRKK